ncbi:putative C-_U-editing enzyme APOBEC-4 [Hyla sarda]|uniref:putative C->U-editing enzyme APOBEC-4 n=1 Tax=Hyla sarda TaxID=327740 RepID=UPI0024C3C34F|nr:putative C->U-editing enzyme APOBEC-4 [Hyla sarda]XP_056379626.1 putative C->U-editing enzyme APOBEC-4 [Hyla sarda]XP_056379627.1 putative C->U-editing enzyme APOBEC-4 [Hyla sarda]
METIFQEFSGYHGTLVKPYYWLYPNHHCVRCPYHIRTGEDSRVTYGEFYEAFGFPYGPTTPENRQLLFYEVKSLDGAVIQKGQASNCAHSDLHVESMLFQRNGYLDSFIYQHNPVGYLTLYTNLTPCNEYGHFCISKIYDLLLKYPDMRLDIYFSQLYHVAEEFPASYWNKEALRSLAGHWPRVTLNPLSNGIWKTVLYSFVKEVPESTLYQPILPVRASADRYNAHMIHLITGVKPYFVDVPPVFQPQEKERVPEYQREKINPTSLPQPQTGFSPYYPMFASHIPSIPVPKSYRPIEANSKPKNVVRHLNMPGNISGDMNFRDIVANARKTNEVIITEEVVKKTDTEANRSRRHKRDIYSAKKSKR